MFFVAWLCVADLVVYTSRGWLSDITVRDNNVTYSHGHPQT